MGREVTKTYSFFLLTYPFFYSMGISLFHKEIYILLHISGNRLIVGFTAVIVGSYLSISPCVFFNNALEGWVTKRKNSEEVDCDEKKFGKHCARVCLIFYCDEVAVATIYLICICVRSTKSTPMRIISLYIG